MIGREAGFERLVTAFENGEVIGSVTGETHPTYYGGCGTQCTKLLLCSPPRTALAAGSWRKRTWSL